VLAILLLLILVVTLTFIFAASDIETEVGLFFSVGWLRKSSKVSGIVALNYLSERA
jgi:hypothetical protein